MKLLIGHTYCETCVVEMTEENYGILRCQECKEKEVGGVYRNDQLERVLELYSTRKLSTFDMLQWIKNLD